MHPLLTFLIGLALGLVALAIAMLRARLRHQRELAAARQDSVRRSRSTLGGKMAEQFAPMLPGFDDEPGDCKFLGDPIDYVVFRGLTEARHGDGALDNLEVVLLDVKSGASQMSKWQRAIAQAVHAGRVRFEVIRVDERGTLVRKPYTPRGGDAPPTGDRA